MAAPRLAVSEVAEAGSQLQYTRRTVASFMAMFASDQQLLLWQQGLLGQSDVANFMVGLVQDLRHDIVALCTGMHGQTPLSPTAASAVLSVDRAHVLGHIEETRELFHRWSSPMPGKIVPFRGTDP